MRLLSFFVMVMVTISLGAREGSPGGRGEPIPSAKPQATSETAPKVAGVYTSILEFASRHALDDAIHSDPSFLMDKHKKSMAGIDDQAGLKLAHDCGFNTLFMTIYPLWGREWYDIPAGRELVRDAVKRSLNSGFKVHLGLSLFNAWFCQDPSKYKGASRTIQCDGTRPTWVCFFDDELWKTYIRNATEMAKVGKEAGGMQGLFVDPEAYGPEEYLCFCDNCVRKFNAYAHEQMPTGLVKPDAWLHAHNLWDKYTKDWHDHEVLRHATDLRNAIHAVDPALQLASLLWDYPVAVGSGDARQEYFRMLAIGLGTPEQPAWTLPEHTYYSDAPDLARIIAQINADLDALHARDKVKILPGLRILRQRASTLADRARIIRDTDVPGYWLYELADLSPSKGIIDFEGAPVDPLADYVKALKEANDSLKK